MKYKTAELDGWSLDLAVAKSQGAAIEHANTSDGWMVVIPGVSGVRVVGIDPGLKIAYAPSVVWDHCGPIIERERIVIGGDMARWEMDLPDSVHVARIVSERLGSSKKVHFATGPTPLIAAMRAYVASKFGDEIELP